MKVFLSFSSTFRSFLNGLITEGELRDGHFVLGWAREKLLVAGTAPARLSSYNKDGPKVIDQNHMPEDYLDPPVREKWLAFRQIIADRDKEGRVTWNKRSENYVKQTRNYLDAGWQVFFEGCWQKSEHLTWVTSED